MRSFNSFGPDPHHDFCIESKNRLRTFHENLHCPAKLGEDHGEGRL